MDERTLKVAKALYALGAYVGDTDVDPLPPWEQVAETSDGDSPGEREHRQCIEAAPIVIELWDALGS